MATTFTLISTVTVGSGGAASIDFTSIPATYTDLILKYSLRTNTSYAGNGFYFQYAFNGSTSNFTQKNLAGNGSTATSSSASAFYGITDPSDWTSSTFANGEAYFPNYAGSTYKSVSQDVVAENNGTLGWDVIYAGLWSQTAAINQITITPAGGSWVQYSSASLYGILKA